MSKDQNTLQTTSNTLVLAPPAETQTVASLSPSARDAAGRAAFDELVGGGGYDSLTASGRDAFVAYGLLDKTDERVPAAKQAALDAVRDAKLAGVFSTSPTPVSKIAESKDPAVRNQSPTGTQGESAGPGATVPSVAPAALEPNTTTPAVAKK
jgi:hypothetical protein